LTPTIWIAGFSAAARITRRPMRPKPLIPTCGRAGALLFKKCPSPMLAIRNRGRRSRALIDMLIA